MLSSLQFKPTLTGQHLSGVNYRHGVKFGNENDKGINEDNANKSEETKQSLLSTVLSYIKDLFKKLGVDELLSNIKNCFKEWLDRFKNVEDAKDVKVVDVTNDSKKAE